MSAQDTTGRSFQGGGREGTLRRLREGFPLSLCPVEVLDLLRAGGPSASRAIAFSGGPDSLFLLLWHRAHFPESGRITALHFNHRTRPGENEREALRAGELAAEWGFAFEPGEREDRGPASEEELRRARFGFLLGAMRAAGADVLLLGHQADDRLETFLGRAARGAGPEGLAAPRPVTDHRRPWPHRRVRPLLRISAGAIRAFLAEEGLRPVEDPSNRVGACLRNRLRHQVVPAWREAEGRDVAAGVARAQEQLAEMAGFLLESARTLFPGGWESGPLATGPLVGAHRALARFVVQRWLGAAGLRPAPSAADSIVEAVLEGRKGRWSSGPGRWIVAGGGVLASVAAQPAVEWGGVGWAAGAALYLPGGGVLRRREIPVDSALAERIARGRVDCAHEAFLRVEGGPGRGLTVRRRRAGDSYRPLGSPGTRKLQDCLVDRKIPGEARDALPVVAAGDRILWVPGLPPAHEARWTGAEATLLRLTYGDR
ncbi:MAG: tRNA lysidine(34) synthetase TilS [Puniceicoccaceae bacterium]